MSIAAMSDTLKRHIVERMKVQYAEISKGLGSEDGLNAYTSYTSTETIRANTDSGKNRHESIMSRGAFNQLAKDFSTVLAKKQLTAIVSNSLTDSISYDNFLAYLKSKYPDKYNNPRVAGDFTYTGASRIGDASGITIATDNTANNSEKDVAILRNIPIGRLVDLYSEFLVGQLSLAPSVSKTDAITQVRGLLNAGHLTGAFNARFIRALGLRKDSTGHIKFDTNNNEATEVEVAINQIMSLLADADYLSSNIYNDVELFTVTDKRLYANKVNLKLTTEVQFKASNQEAGSLLKQAGHAVSDLTKSINKKLSIDEQESAASAAITRLYRNLKDLSAYIAKRLNDLKSEEAILHEATKQKLQQIATNKQALDAIINSSGSRSILDHISFLLSNALKGIKTSAEQSKASLKTKLGTTKQVKQKPVKVKVDKPKNAYTPKKVQAKVETNNLVSLQALLDTHLQDVISANMGDGSAKKILNYRTGRFAASAQVERLTQSKEGMITAFYTYMKNPYATFSEGGKQQFPRTRDPKLLISASIREIGAALVGARMRAVLI